MRLGSQHGGAGLRRLVLLLLATLALALPASASAGLYHPKPAACAFGEDGKSSGSSFEFIGYDRIAFGQAGQRLYALTRPNSGSGSGIYGFDAATVCPSPYPLVPGFEPLLTPELNAEPDLAVDNTALASAGNIYVANREQLLGYDSSGAPLPGFPIPAPAANADWRSVAVDPSGNIWAGDFQRQLHQFSAAGTELNPPLDVSPVVSASGFPRSLAFDSSANLYLADSSGPVSKLAAPAYDPDGGAVQVDPEAAMALAVDRASDDLYVAHRSQIDRYDSAGNLIEQFPAAAPSGEFTGIAVDETSKAVYAYERGTGTDKVNVFQALALPDLATAPLTNLAETTVTLNGSVDPDGLALSDCKFEYLTEAAFLVSGFTDLSSGGEAACNPAFGSIPSSGETTVSAALSGLSPAARYRFRVSASNANGANSSKSVSFALAQPGVETIGSPIRSATTARLDSRLDPHGIATTYHFEYISDAAYEANLAASQPPFEGATVTATHSAGSGGEVVLASQAIEGLAPDTTYHYRVVADNGAFGGAATGEKRTLTTRASDQPLSHGHFPGPPGSDRAWEQVSTPDSSGNPVSAAAGIASDGDSAIYQVTGGTPGSETGTFFNFLFARRPAGEHPASGWATESVYPSRKDATFSTWRAPSGDDQLSTLQALNLNLEVGGAAALWRIPTAGGAPTKLYEAASGVYAGLYVFSDDGSRAILALKGNSVDPAHSSPFGAPQLYDVSSGAPQMVLLPGEAVPNCAAAISSGSFAFPVNQISRTTHWLSPDGSRLIFPSACGGAAHLYVRDFAAAQTQPVDGPLLSGPDCSGAMIRSTPEAVFFWTQSRLVAEDTAIAGGCDSSPGELTPGGDVYRYDLADNGLRCLTCVPGGLAANVTAGAGEGASTGIALAPAGHRLYFTTRSHLLPGAPEAGTPAIYRLDTESEELAYVGPLKTDDRVGENPRGNFDGEGTAVSSDGRFLAFRSAAAGLDQLTGTENGDSFQDYLYDDEERSLLCVSCPADGSAPRAPASRGIIPGAEPSPNMTSLANDGTFAFATPTALVNADQNTAGSGEDPSGGTDVYEWRDGRALLVSDGLTNWPSALAVPRVATISPSGRDLFFTAAAQLTPDALDGYTRLYDARIGGGIAFPEAPKPCPLEVCQGTPKGAPEEAGPGSSSLRGAGNVVEAPARCRKGKVRRKGRCVARKHKRAQRAKHDRRNAR